MTLMVQKIFMIQKCW